MKKKFKLNLTFPFIFDTFTYAVSYIFLAIIVFAIVRAIVQIAMEETVIRYYLCGILIIFASGISIANIESYNKKYRKNDSDSSKRQNDYLFESDIRREEGRYADRRELEQPQN